MKSLKLFRASAGSGKTFTLTVEYIKLLLKNQYEYRHTLAVTFTNKATTEMKERILGTLYGLKCGLKDTENYFKKLKNDPEILSLDISDAEIRRRAGVALHNLTHDYNRFRIETIDSFFLSILRDLAREMDLTANRSIDMNNEEVLDEAVDNLIDGLNEKSNILGNLTRFIDEKMEDDGKWKVKDELKDFGKNVFNEKYMEKSALLDASMRQENFVHKYRQSLVTLRATAEKEIKKSAEDFMRICKENGWEEADFTQKKKGVFGFFQSIINDNFELKANSYVNNALTGEAKHWSKKKEIQERVEGELLPLLLSIMEKRESFHTVSNSVTAILAHLNHMMLLGEINEKVKDLNNDANRFLLSNTAILLQRMIDGSSVPFIYEKTGARLKHIMIDEFQDTSALQWSNFMPLLMNSLDEGEMCLIVGDVKQSIYRWRNSDWQILNGINDDRYFGQRIAPQKPLDFNRRSLGNVITFNNLLFANAVSRLNEEYKKTHGGKDSYNLVNAYSGVQQKLLKNKQGLGYVRVERLTENRENVEGEKFNYTERSYSRVVEIVEELIAKGYKQNDICILIRSNRHIPVLTQKFAESQQGITLVSSEAYRLDASLCVNIIVLTIKYLLHPDDRFNLFKLVRLLHRDNNNDSSLLTMKTEELEAFLPEGLVENKDNLIYEPLKELIEEIFVLYNLKQYKGQDAYLFYFHDQITAFSQGNNTDLESFVELWEASMHSKTIPSGGTKGVSIMSIHKSKGLEFPIVIAPFCDWSIKGNPNDLLWCTPGEAPYDELQLTAVNYASRLEESIFSQEYDEENLRFCVDNLNLLYVSFTRAKDQLIILTKEDKRKEDKTEFTDVSQIILSSIPNAMKHSELEGVGSIWELEPDDAAKQANEEFVGENEVLAPVDIELVDKKNVLDMKYDEEKVLFDSEATPAVLKQSHAANEWREDLKGIDIYNNDKQQRGILFHTVFQNLDTASSLPRVLDHMFMEGFFRSVLEKEEVGREISKALEDKVASRWFAEGWTVINERSILSKNPETGKIEQCRPDRVITNGKETIVIDYKTGRYSEDHKIQVAAYMKHLTDMGYANVKGYVWYIMWGKTIRVKE